MKTSPTCDQRGLRLGGGEQQLRLRLRPADDVDESLDHPRIELGAGAVA